MKRSESETAICKLDIERDTFDWIGRMPDGSFFQCSDKDASELAVLTEFGRLFDEFWTFEGLVKMVLIIFINHSGREKFGGIWTHDLHSYRRTQQVNFVHYFLKALENTWPIPDIRQIALDESLTGRNNSPFLYSLYEWYCIFRCVWIWRSFRSKSPRIGYVFCVDLRNGETLWTNIIFYNLI